MRSHLHVSFTSHDTGFLPSVFDYTWSSLSQMSSVRMTELPSPETAASPTAPARPSDSEKQRKDGVLLTDPTLQRRPELVPVRLSDSAPPHVTAQRLCLSRGPETRSRVRRLPSLWSSRHYSVRRRPANSAGPGTRLSGLKWTPGRHALWDSKSPFENTP